MGHCLVPARCCTRVVALMGRRERRKRMIRTPCPMCGVPLVIETTPGGPGTFEVGPAEKLTMLRSYLQAGLDALDKDQPLVAVHATITAGGMAQAELPELAYHDCYPRGEG